MSTDKIKKFLAENLRFVKILKRVIEYEESHVKDMHYLGWKWSGVRAYSTE
jgi:hypothetical protein